jgi:phosphoribosyl 1,2-cyclic phosphodiesterase
MDDAIRALERSLEEATLVGVRRDRRDLARQAEPAQRREIVFVGTGGSPINLMRQARATGGFFIELPEVRMYVDPGPGALSHARALGLPLEDLDAVYVSHGHTDHYTDAGAVVECMCRAMSVRRGLLLAPRPVLDEGLVSAFHQGRRPESPYPGGPRTVALDASSEVELGDGAILRTVAAHHAGENYGFVLETPMLRVGYTSDTGYLLAYRNEAGERVAVEAARPILDFEAAVDVHLDLKAAFADVDVLVANVTFMNHFASRQLTAVGLGDLLTGTAVGQAVITHLDPALSGDGEDRTPLLAEYVERVSGVPTRLARDGMRLVLRPRERGEIAAAYGDGEGIGG